MNELNSAKMPLNFGTDIIPAMGLKVFRAK
jgi:hypothetical protein